MAARTSPRPARGPGPPKNLWGGPQPPQRWPIRVRLPCIAASFPEHTISRYIAICSTGCRLVVRQGLSEQELPGDVEDVADASFVASAEWIDFGDFTGSFYRPDMNVDREAPGSLLRVPQSCPRSSWDPRATLSATRTAWGASMAPAGIERSPAMSRATAICLLAPATNHTTCRVAASPG